MYHANPMLHLITIHRREILRDLLERVNARSEVSAVQLRSARREGLVDKLGNLTRKGRRVLLDLTTRS